MKKIGRYLGAAALLVLSVGLIFGVRYYFGESRKDRNQRLQKDKYADQARESIEGSKANTNQSINNLTENILKEANLPPSANASPNPGRQP